MGLSAWGSSRGRVGRGLVALGTIVLLWHIVGYFSPVRGRGGRGGRAGSGCGASAFGVKRGPRWGWW